MAGTLIVMFIVGSRRRRQFRSSSNNNAATNNKNDQNGLAFSNGLFDVKRSMYVPRTGENDNTPDPTYQDLPVSDMAAGQNIKSIDQGYAELDNSADGGYLDIFVPAASNVVVNDAYQSINAHEMQETSFGVKPEDGEDVMDTRQHDDEDAIEQGYMM